MKYNTVNNIESKYIKCILLLHDVDSFEPEHINSFYERARSAKRVSTDTWECRKVMPLFV